MVDFDSLVRCRNAAIGCNEAAKSGAAFFQNEPSNPEFLPFPLDQTASTCNWLAEVERSLREWNDAAYPIGSYQPGADSPLAEIQRAAVSLERHSFPIGSSTYLTAHEAAAARARVLQECLSGQRSELPDGASLDLFGEIQREFLKAVEGKLPAAPGDPQAPAAVPGPAAAGYVDLLKGDSAEVVGYQPPAVPAVVEPCPRAMRVLGNASRFATKGHSGRARGNAGPSLQVGVESQGLGGGGKRNT